MQSPRKLQAIARVCVTAGALVITGALVSCGGSGGDVTGPSAQGAPSQVVSISVTPSASSLPVGSSLPLNAQARDGGNQAVDAGQIFWSSSDTAVAIVSSAGVVTARAVGSAQIAASAAGKSGVAAITVTPVPVASVAVVPGAATVSISGTLHLSAVAYDSAGGSLSGRSVVWASQAPSVATVAADGTVTGVAAGTATITATCGGRSGSATVTVTLVPVARVAITPGALTLATGQAASLSVATYDANGNVLGGRGVTWSTSNANVATVVGSGLVSAASAGTATITATSEGKSASVQIVVSAAPPPAPAPVAAVVVSPSSGSLTVGGSLALTATALDSNRTVLAGRSVTWSSSAPQVASVNAGGGVTGVAAGTATISATIDGVSGAATVTVNTPPTPPPAAVSDVRVTPSSASLLVGGATILSAAALDASGNVLAGRSVSWVTSAPSVATVSPSGSVTGTGPGTATITATIEGHSASAQISVSAPPPAAVAAVVVSPAVDTLTPSGSIQLSATLRDGNGNVLTGRSVVWYSSAPQIATVDSTSGLVRAVATGTATITARSGSASGTAAITVASPPVVPVAAVRVSPPTAALTVGGTQQLTATTVDASGNTLTGRVVVWLSGNPFVATVNQSGVVTAIAPGTVTVTAISELRIGSATISVAGPVRVASVTVSPSVDTVDIGATTPFAATLKDSAGNVLTGRTVTWSSSNAGIASVSSSGVVTGVSAGTITLTATSGTASGTAHVTVVPVAPARISVSPASLDVAVGDSSSLTATVYDRAGNVYSSQTVNWSSDESRTLSVSGTGARTARINAKRPGSATITASVGQVTATVPATIH